MLCAEPSSAMDMQVEGKRAEQRIRLMQQAQPMLQPSPRCLDSSPAGAMQRCHRESVVQFINEVWLIAGTTRRQTRRSCPRGSHSLTPPSPLAQVCEDFGLQTQTAGLAVSYFDRFLSKVEQRGLDKDRVQLLAITCTLIAAKFSEIKMPGLDDLCEVAHNKYSKAELKEMELETLRMLQWELHAVTPHAALEQLAIIINHTEEPSKPFLEHAEFFIDMSYYEVRSSALLAHTQASHNTWPRPFPPHDLPSPSHPTPALPKPYDTVRPQPTRPDRTPSTPRAAVQDAQLPAARHRLVRPALRVGAPRQREGGAG